MKFKNIYIPLIVTSLIVLLFVVFGIIKFAINSKQKSEMARAAAGLELLEGNISNAIYYYSISKYLNQEDVNVYFSLGSIYFDLGMYKVAYDEFGKGLGLSDKMPDKELQLIDIDKMQINCYLGYIANKLSLPNELDYYKKAANYFKVPDNKVLLEGILQHESKINPERGKVLLVCTERINKLMNQEKQ